MLSCGLQVVAVTVLQEVLLGRAHLPAVEYGVEGSLRGGPDLGALVRLDHCLERRQRDRSPQGRDSEELRDVEAHHRVRVLAGGLKHGHRADSDVVHPAERRRALLEFLARKVRNEVRHEVAPEVVRRGDDRRQSVVGIAHRLFDRGAPWPRRRCASRASPCGSPAGAGARYRRASRSPSAPSDRRTRRAPSGASCRARRSTGPERTRSRRARRRRYGPPPRTWRKPPRGCSSPARDRRAAWKVQKTTSRRGPPKMRTVAWFAEPD